MPQSSPELADELIARLNELCANDDAKAAIGRLMDKRILTPKGAFPIADGTDEKEAVGLLHVLNSAVGVDANGHGLIAAVLEGEGQYFNGFVRYVSPDAPSTPALTEGTQGAQGPQGPETTEGTQGAQSPDAQGAQGPQASEPAPST